MTPAPERPGCQNTRSDNPVLIIPSIRKYIVTTRIDPDSGYVGTELMWLCGVMVDYGSGPTDPVTARSAAKSEALAEALGRAIRSARDRTTGATYVLPHEVVHHRLTRTCDCLVCQLISEGTLGSGVHLTPGDPDEQATGFAHVQAQVRQWTTLVSESRTRKRVGDVEVMAVSRRPASVQAQVGVEDLRRGTIAPTMVDLPDGVLDEVDIYTDASLSMSSSVPARAGVAAVDGSGWFSVRVVDTRKCGTDRITYAELVAVESALLHWIGRARKIVVHTDSRNARRLIRRVIEHGHCGSSGRGSVAARSIATMIGDYQRVGGQIEVRWVRGHSGVRGNELADELSLHVRRALVGRCTHGLRETPVPLETTISLAAAKVSESTGRTPVMARGSLELCDTVVGTVNDALARRQPITTDHLSVRGASSSLSGAVA